MNIGGLGSVSTGYVRASSNSFDVVAQWVETLHGHGDFRDAIEVLCNLVDASVGNVSRVARETNSTKPVAVFDRDAGKLFSNRNPHIFGVSLIDEVGLPARDGTVWIYSELLRDADVELSHALQNEISDTNLRDLVLIPLSAERDWVDYLEVQFTHEIAEHDKVLLIALASTLTKTWKSRLPGTAERLIAQTRSRRAITEAPAASCGILDISNPAKLSRSEYRICALVNEGLLVQEIATELSIQKSTMRSHLSSIYGKTGVSSHVELIHALSHGDRGSIVANTSRSIA